jgi:hypothetical protein
VSEVREAAVRAPDGEDLPSGRSEQEVVSEVREAAVRAPDGEDLPSGRSEQEVLQ